MENVLTALIAGLTFVGIAFSPLAQARERGLLNAGER
jgi:hypothetical protein